jgi:hypothetical protein
MDENELNPDFTTYEIGVFCLSTYMRNNPARLKGRNRT